MEVVDDLQTNDLDKDLHACPMVGINYHGFMNGFESRGNHECEEQWNARDSRVFR
jgi:hypothetical protein